MPPSGGIFLPVNKVNMRKSAGFVDFVVRAHKIEVFFYIIYLQCNRMRIYPRAYVQQSQRGDLGAAAYNPPMDLTVKHDLDRLIRQFDASNASIRPNIYSVTPAAKAGTILSMRRPSSDGKRLRGAAAVKRRAGWLARHPLCETCLSKGFITPAQEVDHIVPLFRGGKDDESNLASICVSCHQEKTRADMGWSTRPGCDASGLPVDPQHHWNR